MIGRLPGTLVVAPQAPPVPNAADWNWRDHVKSVARFVQERFANRRVVATGFSRGGLGVLQILAEYPDLFERWAIVDPQPAGDRSEQDAILSSSAIGQGWLRYGIYRGRSAAWTHFASALEHMVPEANRDLTKFDHGEMALRAYAGDSLSSATKPHLYDFLGVRL
jgi:pimeloyl-ACP methyl ester carboxylesterase